MTNTWKQLRPGFYDDGCGNLHVVITEALAAAGYEDNMTNRLTLVLEIVKQFPSVELEN